MIERPRRHFRDRGGEANASDPRQIRDAVGRRDAYVVDGCVIAVGAIALGLGAVAATPPIP